MEELAELNELEDPNLIQAGAQILLAFPRQFIEELAQSVPSRPREGATEAAHTPRLTVRVSERREERAKVRRKNAVIQKHPFILWRQTIHCLSC